MDERTALIPGTRLCFPGLTCNIVSEIGRGSNALVYRAWYADHYHGNERHEVMVKELFPLHPGGGIYRAEDGGIICAPEGRQTYEKHRNSFEAGNAAHLALLRKQPDDTGANLNTYALKGTLYTVLGFNGGHSLSECLRGPATSLRPLVGRMLKLLDAVEGFYESGLLHLDIAPDNIMLLGSGRRERVMLIDYNSCQRIDAPVDSQAVFSIKPGFTAPEIRLGRYRDVGLCTDLYSVTAVLFCGITGEALTASQSIRRQPPDVSQCPCMTDMPDTVVSWTRTVLRRGLEALASRRYQSVGEMREDLSELLDRIDGVGVTHSALWEAGRRNVQRMVRDNPSMAFIRDRDRMLPSNAMLEGKVSPAGEQFRRIMDSGEDALLIAGGGMGKTTALVSAAMEQTGRYAPNRPAVAYLSLYGWQPGERDYILNRVLETLRFKPETRSFEDARKALKELLDRPLSSARGTTPALMLMLDGLNETTGERQPLIDEILRLSGMGGVGLVVASRADESALPFKRLELCALEEADVRKALSGAGLLVPESEEIRRLLRTPLMLSIFIQSSLIERGQLGVKTQDNLMEAYFAALREKEVAALPDNSEARWQIEAALDFVLPSLARELSRRNRALDDARLLPVAENCWRLLNARLMRRAFPRWIGHSQAIRGRAGNAEEWYGCVVHELLWKRMGLLIRDGQGRYQISHQIIAEYLLKKDRENRRRIVYRRRLRRLLIGVVAALALAGGALVIRQAARPKPYAADAAETVYEYAVGAYEDAMAQYQVLRDASDLAGDGPEGYAVAVSLPMPSDNAIALDKLKQMVREGEVMPWSGLPIDQDSCEALLALPGALREEYAVYLRTLNYVMTDEAAYQRYVVGEGYRDALSELLEIDARIAGTLYDRVCLPHLKDSSSAADAARKNGEYDEKTLNDLKLERSKALEKLKQTAAIEAEARR